MTNFCRTLLILLFAAQAFSQVEHKAGRKGHVLVPETVEATQERIRSLSAPAGFKVETFAHNLGKPRMIAIRPDGSVYVTRRQPGDVLVMRDTDSDGKADKQETAVTLPEVHGIAFRGEQVYLATVREVFRAPINANGAFGKLERVIDGLPEGGNHPNRTLGLGPDGKLYITVGSTCNACEEKNEESAAVLQADPESGERGIFARGLRNTIGFDWHPQTRAFYGLDHGIDWLGDEEQKEELNLIEKGKHYGWPYAYDNNKPNPNIRPKHVPLEEFLKSATPPALSYTAHAAPLGLTFYRGSAFPQGMRRDAFATMHGSWNRQPASGYEVVRIRFENNQPVAFEKFISGFLLPDGKTRFGRPCGIAVHPDGSLMFTDDENGVVYKVSHTNRNE